MQEAKERVRPENTQTPSPSPQHPNTCSSGPSKTEKHRGSFTSTSAGGARGPGSFQCDAETGDRRSRSVAALLGKSLRAR